MGADPALDWGDREEANPHSKVIGKKFLSNFKKNKVYIESLKLSDLKTIPFENGGFPKFACDLFKYITLFDMEAFYEAKRKRYRREQKALKLFGDASRFEEFDSDEEQLDLKSRHLKKEIKAWEKSLGPKLIKKVFACFRGLCKNAEDDV